MGETACMKLEEAIVVIEKYSERMNVLYGSVVFDEWAIVLLVDGTGNIRAYSGPRKENFQASFSADIETLKTELLAMKHLAGDFEFARHGSGTRFDAFMVLGEGLFLICNNTTQSIDGITEDPRWFGAQVPFAELAERFRAGPLEND